VKLKVCFIKCCKDWLIYIRMAIFIEISSHKMSFVIICKSKFVILVTHVKFAQCLHLHSMYQQDGIAHLNSYFALAHITHLLIFLHWPALLLSFSLSNHYSLELIRSILSTKLLKCSELPKRVIGLKGTNLLIPCVNISII
jgi:hypothetical protein